MVYNICPPKRYIRGEKRWMKHFLIVWNQGTDVRIPIRKERKDPSIYIQHPRGRHIHTHNNMYQSMNTNQYTMDP
jgi:hypothetical protein